MADKDEDQTIEDQTTEDQAEGEEEEIELPGDDEPTGDPTEDELALLTDEERAALMGDDEDADEADADDPPQAEEEVAQQDEPEQTPPAEAAKAEEPEPVRVDKTALQPLLDEAKSKKAAVFRDYEDGELTRDQYLAAVEEIDAEYAEKSAELAAQVQSQSAERNQWVKTAKAYLSEVPALATPDHVDAFDAHVRAVTADPRSKGLTFRQMLEKAHRRYLADQPDIEAKIPALPGAKATAKEADPAIPRKQPKPEAPITLARVPSSVASGVSDGRFGQLQQAIENAETAEQIEKIMAGMTEAEREAFASMDV